MVRREEKQSEDYPRFAGKTNVHLHNTATANIISDEKGEKFNWYSSYDETRSKIWEMAVAGRGQLMQVEKWKSRRPMWNLKLHFWPRTASG